MIHFTNPQYTGPYLPHFFSENDPRSATEQAHAAYSHGGGWSPFTGFILHKATSEGQASLKYPEDPPMRELSRASLRDETIILFESSWVAIVQPNGTYEVSRMD